MKKITSVLAVGTIGILSFSQNTHAALVVTPSTSASTLANSLVGSGITISNASLVGGDGQAGLFSGGSSANLPINNGIILSTGLASEAVGTSGVLRGLEPITNLGDQDLEDMTGQTTYDASTLSFDFQFGDGSTGGDLYFNFLFASEEYPEYVGSAYNDAFAIFLNGNNIALLPGTSTPVTINNVNANANSQYYLDNAAGTYLTAYNALTTRLQATVLGLGAGTHSIKFAIGDIADGTYDSAVLIEAGSFGSAPLGAPAAVPEPGQVAASLLLLGGIGGYVFLKRRKAAKVAAPAAA